MARKFDDYINAIREVVNENSLDNLSSVWFRLY